MDAVARQSNAGGGRRSVIGTAFLRLALLSALAAPLVAFAQGGRAAAIAAEAPSLLATLAYAGFTAALLLDSLLQFLTNRDRAYLEYAGLALGAGFAQIALGLLHGDARGVPTPAWAVIAEPCGLALAGMSAALFARDFLRTPTLAPRFDIALRIFAVVFGLALAGTFALPGDYANTLVAGIGPAFALLAVGCGLHCRQRRAPGAMLFVAGLSAMLFGAVLYLATHTGLLPAEGLAVHAIQLASALGLLTLSLGLAERTGSSWRERAARHAEEIASCQHTIEALQASEQFLAQGVAQRNLELDALARRLQESEQRFQQMSHHDPLTGLANQLLLTDRIDQGIIRARRHNTRTAVLMLDLDEFTAINDSYGPAVGDEILKTVAQRLRGIVRDQDTVARPENDQFVIVLEEIFDANDLQRVASAAAATVGEVIHVGGQTFILDASVGSAISTNEGCNAATLLKQAGKLMRRAKEGKRLNRQHDAARA